MTQEQMILKLAEIVEKMLEASPAFSHELRREIKEIQSAIKKPK